MSNLLELQKISKTFEASTPPAVDQVSFGCSEGQILAVLGSSGSGKTTLLRIIAGLEMPDSGRITLKGETINDPSEYVSPENRGCTLVFQDYALFPNMTVKQNVSFGKTAKNNRKLINELLRLTKISGLQNRYPHQISGGEQQRVALVRALATQPALLLLDEPLSHLDPELRDNVRRELVNIFKKTETTTLFVSHDTEDALSMADKIVVMQEGKAVQIGTPMELYSYPINRYVALLFGKTNLVPRELIPNISHYFLDEDTEREITSIRPNQWKTVDFNTNKNVPVFSGKITAITLKGTHQEVCLKTNSIDLIVTVPMHSSVKTGNTITVAFNGDD